MMAGGQNINGMQAPLPTSPSGMEDICMNFSQDLSHQSNQALQFDPHTLQQLVAIVSMESDTENPLKLPEISIPNPFPGVVVKTEPGLQNILSCSGGIDNGQLPTLDDSFLTKSKPDLDFNYDSSSTSYSQDVGPYMAVGIKKELESPSDDKQPLNWSLPVSNNKLKAPSGRKGLKETDKRERRKAQNRQAAKNYREKQKNKKDRVELDYTHLIAENAAKEQEVEGLKQQLAELQKILEDHKAQGTCNMQHKTECATTAVSCTHPAPMIHQQALGQQRITVPISARDDLNMEQVPAPPVTPLLNQTFGFDSGLYSPGSDVLDKVNGPNRVLSPLQQAMSPSGCDLNTVGAATPIPTPIDYNLAGINTSIDMNSWASTMGVWNEMNGNIDYF